MLVDGGVPRRRASGHEAAEGTKYVNTGYHCGHLPSGCTTPGVTTSA